MHKILQFSKDELINLSYRENDGSEHHLRLDEVGEIRMLFHYLSHLKARGFLPEDRESFRFNSISRRDWSNFAMDPDSIALLNSTKDIGQAPHNSGLI